MQRKVSDHPQLIACRRGATFVELIVYTAIFVILSGMVAGVFFWLRKTNDSSQRLDLLGALRGSTFRLSQELALGTDIIYPSERRLNKPCHQLVFTDQVNDVIAIYLDSSGHFCRMNLREYEKDPSKGVTILSQYAIEFRVIRKGVKYVEYSLTIKEPGEKGRPPIEFTYTNSARLKNHLN
jgi:hypothetical protein